ncbi:methylase involved in ubiquinone/menaquinone biosynthesis [Gottschalkia purinilytica]|uniref:Methylase involved in ubiquinone/menaquinone biosynthesis n=2 Tax=Gottschalkia purinilytica TaxID=1503 RepID=A0A0L0WF82_GOTPU|nr:methylase involved in ubiquinone/menaquinone biosynthesis [Gottschalkia purinilytica]
MNKDYNFDIIQNNNLNLEDRSIDYILIMAVLHHISTQDIKEYLIEFKRVLKKDGKLVIIEPCFFKENYFTNWLMNTFDKGKYIRNETSYLNLFSEQLFQVETTKKLRKGAYNELFFVVSQKNNF